MTKRYQERLDDLRGAGSYVGTVEAKDAPIDGLWVGKGFIVARVFTRVDTAADYDIDRLSEVSIGYKMANDHINWEHQIPPSKKIEVETVIQDG